MDDCVLLSLVESFPAKTVRYGNEKTMHLRELLFNCLMLRQKRGLGTSCNGVFQGLLREIRFLSWISEYQIKTPELNNQTAKSLKWSFPLLHKWLLNYSCNGQNERLSSTFSHLWINLSTVSHFTSKDNEIRVAGSGCGSMNWKDPLYPMQHSQSVLTCEGAEDLASCDQELLSEWSFFEEGGSLHCGCLSCLNPLRLCSPVWDEQAGRHF